jgi:hypothetical protein
MLAFCAGTGGSCLIIGSAAGVAAMGLERIDFMWYLRYIAPLALAGYLCGAATLGLLDAYVFNNGSAKSDKAFINGEVSLCLPFEGSILSLNSCRR